MKSLSQKFLYAILVSLMLLGAAGTQGYASPERFLAGQQHGDGTVDSALDYLETQLNPDGGIRWMDEDSSMAVTLRVVMALTANHFSQDRLISETGLRPVDFLSANGEDWVNQVDSEGPGFSVARAGQLLAAIAAADLNPHQFGEGKIDLVYQINLQYDQTTGVFGGGTPDNVIGQVWAILGLAANGFKVPEEAAMWLAHAQGEDGSWNDGYGSFLDTTPLAMLALTTSGYTMSDSPEMQLAIRFMQNQQQPEGGWMTQWDTVTNASTTGVMLQVIAALDEIPMDGNWQKMGGNPYNAVLSLVQEDGRIGGDYANAYSTADALIGLSGQPLYKLGTLVKTSQAFDFLLNQQHADGGWGDLLPTIDAFLAIVATGWDPSTVSMGEGDPLSALVSMITPGFSDDPEIITKTIAAISISSLDPTNINETNLVNELKEIFNPATATFGDPASTKDQAYGILGLAAAGESLPTGALSSLLGLQHSDGGWPINSDGDSSPYPTALAIQALLAAGEAEDAEPIQDALSYLSISQHADGGWGDSLSTSAVIMALNALGINPESWITETGHSPITALNGYQKTNGSFVVDWNSSSDNLSATTAALRALFSGSNLLPENLPKGQFAGLVIDSGDSELETACVPLTDGLISGLDLLAASGFSYNADEGFISSIMDISNPDGETNYWSYWHWDGQTWVFNNIGLNDSNVLPGTIEAWHFTSWERFPSLPPDVVADLGEICNTSVLKNYAIEPNLNYTDLFHARSGQNYTIAAESKATAEPTPTSILNDTNLESTQTPAVQKDAPARSILPLVIIGSVGLVVLVIVILIYVKKHK